MYLHRREMAETTNFTEDVLQKIKKELSCSPQYNPKVDNELKLLSALNIFLSITAFLGDTLVLVALHRETSLHPPSKLLYRNLAITAWSLCWYHCGTSSCYLLDFCGERELEDLLLRRFDSYFYWQHFMRGYFVYIDCKECGQAICSVFGNQIQRCCDFEKGKDNCNCHVGFVNCRRIKLLLESCYNVVVYAHRFIFVPCYSNLLLHEDFSQFAS